MDWDVGWKCKKLNSTPVLDGILVQPLETLSRLVSRLSRRLNFLVEHPSIVCYSIIHGDKHISQRIRSVLLQLFWMMLI